MYRHLAIPSVATTFALAIFLLLPSKTLLADIVPGILHDFENGTTEGWAPTGTNISDGGPSGSGDNYLEVVAGGVGGLFAIHNTSLSGAVDPAVTGFSVDLKQDPGEPSLEMRLVLFGQNVQDRWTSSAAISIPNDGSWRNYFFSLAQADLIYVPTSQGTGASYDSMLQDVNRVMLRHDPVGVSGGTSASGILGMDNFATVAVPEPTFLSILGVGTVFLLGVRRRH